MFDSLKKKLGSWFKKEEDEEEEKKPAKDKAKKVDKVEKGKKATKETKESKKETKGKEIKKEKEKGKGKEIKKETKKSEIQEKKDKENKEEKQEKKEIQSPQITTSSKDNQETKKEEEKEGKELVKEEKKEKRSWFNFRREKKQEEKEEKTAQASEDELETIGEHEDEETLDKDVEDAAEELADETIEESAHKTDTTEEEEDAEEETEDDEEEREEEKEEESGGFFSRLAKKLTSSALSEEDFGEFFSEYELILLEHNVALEVVDKMRDILSKELVGKQYKKQEVQGKILASLTKSIDSVLLEPPDIIAEIKKAKKPYVILFFGINGSGKTTSIAKFAYLLKQKGLSCVLAAADTFRAASIEQLQTHGERVGVPVVAQNYLSDPAAVAFDAIAYAKKHAIDVVLIDTAGRMYTQSNLMREMEKIVRVSNANLKLFVGESITGNDATEQARMFGETAGIDGIILSKADVDEKAGTILSVGSVTGKPIYFLGVGQEYKDLEVFSKKVVFKNLGLA